MSPRHWRRRQSRRSSRGPTAAEGGDSSESTEPAWRGG